MGLDIARKDVVVAKVICHTADVAGVAYGDGSNARAVFAVTAGQLFSEMHGVTHGAAVTTGEGLALVLEAFNQQFCRTLDIP